MDCQKMAPAMAVEAGLLRRIMIRHSVSDEGLAGRACAGLALHEQHQGFGSSEPWCCSPVAGGGSDDLFVNEVLDLRGIAEDPEEQKGEQGEGNGSNPDTSGVSFEALTPPDPDLPEGDISDLEWVSRIVDDCFMDIPCPAISPAFTVPKPPAPETNLLTSASASLTVTTTTHSRSTSSGSVISISSPGASAVSLNRTWTTTFSTEAVAVPSKSRTKRARTGGRVWSIDRPDLLESLCSSAASSSSSCSSSSLSSCLVFEPQGLMATTFDYVPVAAPPLAPRGRGRPPLHKKLLPNGEPQQEQKKPKKKGRKPKSSSASSAAALALKGQAAEDGVSGRRCSHCGVQKTPQWRTGPMGAKTLCNACGVRFKSGRLLPEYRPAWSPTFVSSIHSNCHRKVLEMRLKKEMQEQLQHQHQTVLFPGESFVGSPPPPASPALSLGA